MPLAFSVCGKFKSCVAIDGNFSVPLAKNMVESIAQKREKLSITKIDHIHAGEFLYTAFSKS
jgi:hypothetical protein